MRIEGKHAISRVTSTNARTQNMYMCGHKQNTDANTLMMSKGNHMQTVVCAKVGISSIRACTLILCLRSKACGWYRRVSMYD